MQFSNEIEKYEYLQTRIDEIMDWFNFEKVNTAMTALNWVWSGCDGVPDIQYLRNHVRKAMKHTFNEVVGGKTKSAYITGGFNIQCIHDEEEDVIFFKVVFELADWMTDES